MSLPHDGATDQSCAKTPCKNSGSVSGSSTEGHVLSNHEHYNMPQRSNFKAQFLTVALMIQLF